MKYRHRGYKDDERDDNRAPREERPPPRDRDLPGGRLAVPQRAIRNLRCHHCGHAQPLELDARGDVLPVKFDAACARCGTAVHACRNCIHFDPDAHNECRRPVKVRLRKDQANECEWFDPKLVVEMTRDENRPEGSFSPTAGSTATPRTQADARRAFEDLFKSPAR